MSKLPIINIIEKAQHGFISMYGFPAEKLHASAAFERVLQRWANTQTQYQGEINYEGAEICGLEVVQSTKKSSPHVEFWLSAVRNTQVHSVHVRVEPDQVGAIKALGNEIIQLETPEASYDDPDLGE